MNILQRFYPGDVVIWTIALVLVQMTVVVVVAAVVARLISRRGAAARYGVWLSALICVTFCPLVTLTGDRLEWQILSVPLPSELSALREPEHVGENKVAARNVRIGQEPIAKQDNRERDEQSRDPDQIAASADQPLAKSNPAGPVEVVDHHPGDFTGEPSSDRDTPRKMMTMVSKREAKKFFAEKHAPVDLDVRTSITTGNEGAIEPRALFQSVVGALMLLWIAGLLFRCVRLLRGFRWVRVLRRDAIPIDDEPFNVVLARVVQRLDGGQLGTIAASRRALTPLVIGLWRTTVLIPERLLSVLRDTELEDVLVHECAHSVRHDLFIGLLQRLLAMLFWPHPLIHALNRQLSRAREEICDNHVLRSGDARRYAGTLLTVAEQVGTEDALPVGISLLSSRWKLEDRIAGLLDKGRTVMTRMNRIVLLSLFAAFAITAVFIAGVRLGEAGQPLEPGKQTRKKPIPEFPKGEIPLRVLWSKDRLQKGDQQKPLDWPLVTVARQPQLDKATVDAFLTRGKLELKTAKKWSPSSSARHWTPESTGDRLACTVTTNGSPLSPSGGRTTKDDVGTSADSRFMLFRWAS